MLPRSRFGGLRTSRRNRDGNPVVGGVLALPGCEELCAQGFSALSSLAEVVDDLGGGELVDLGESEIELAAKVGEVVVRKIGRVGCTRAGMDAGGSHALLRQSPKRHL